MNTALKTLFVTCFALALAVSAFGDPTNAPVSGTPVRISPDAKIVPPDQSGLGGLGLVIDVAADGILVKKVLPDDPGSKAGVLESDIITGVDARPTKGLSLRAAVKCLRGPVGSEVELTLLRKGVTDPIKLKMTRQLVPIHKPLSTVPPPSETPSRP